MMAIDFSKLTKEDIKRLTDYIELLCKWQQNLEELKVAEGVKEEPSSNK